MSAVVARRGVGGWRQYRIPALATVGDVVLCAYDGRPDHDDLPAPIDLLIRRSTDGGVSWGPQQVVRSGTGIQGYGDPSLLVDPAVDRVLLFHAAGERAGFFESGTGEDPADPDLQQCDLAVSDDHGLTWTHRRLTGELRSSGNAHLLDHEEATGADSERIAGLFATSGAGCAIVSGPYAGRLVQPYVLRIGDRIDAACALSDDHGATWRLGRPLGAELNESSACALPDGTVLLHSRGRPNRLAAVSTDGGETFSPMTPVGDLLDPSVNGSVIAVGDVLLASHCADPELRRNAVVSRSDDLGRSWRTVRVLEPGQAAYTQLAVLPGGRVGVAYEADGYREIRFEDFSLDRDLADAIGGSPATAGAGWTRASMPGGTTLDLQLDAVVPARPAVWQEAGPTHSIDLSRYHDVDAAVFKEIGQDRTVETTQVLRSRESLEANLGPVTPGIRVGDRLKVHARVRAGDSTTRVRWEDTERILGPGVAWVRLDLTHTVTPAEVARGRAVVETVVEVDGRAVGATLIVGTAD